MTDTATDLDDGRIGDNEFAIKWVFKDRADLLAKMRATLESMEADSAILFDKPVWIESYRGNCCGGSGP